MRLFPLAAALVVCLPSWITPAAAEPCPCRWHNAEAHGQGTCSKSSDENYCFMSFGGAAAHRHEERLRELGLTNVDPGQAFDVANSTRPEDWPGLSDGNFSLLAEYLTVLMASSQLGELSSFTETTFAILKNNAERIAEGFTDPDASLDEPLDDPDFDDARLNISYGCVELLMENNTFSSMIKTPYSTRVRFCNEE